MCDGAFVLFDPAASFPQIGTGRYTVDSTATKLST
eukprot:COSAG03_NODE_14891_length_448_cov_0.931232_2_plen_34_part_01